LFTFSDLYWVCLSVFSCTVLLVSISQVIGCEDRLRNDYTVSGGALNSTPTNHDYIMCCIHVHIQSSEFNLYWVGFTGCSQNFVYDGFVDIGVLWLGFETDTVGAGIHVAIKPCNSCFQSELLTTAIFVSKYFLCGKIVGMDLLPSWLCQ